MMQRAAKVLVLVGLAITSLGLYGCVGEALADVLYVVGPLLL